MKSPTTPQENLRKLQACSNELVAQRMNRKQCAYTVKPFRVHMERSKGINLETNDKFDDKDEIEKATSRLHRTSLSAEKPANLRRELPPSFCQPYTEIAEQSHAAATGEFESLSRLHHVEQDDVKRAAGAIFASDDLERGD